MVSRTIHYRWNVVFMIRTKRMKYPMFESNDILFDSSYQSVSFGQFFVVQTRVYGLMWK